MVFSRVSVIGSGTMGHGIAHVVAASGSTVRLYDVDAGRVAAAIQKIKGNLDKGVEKGKLTAEARDNTLARIEGVTTLAEAAEADLIVEAIPEKLELKADLFVALDALAPETAVFGTNTSSLSVAAIAASLRDPSRMVGMHFFNPVHIMPLLEVVVHAGTAADVAEKARDFGAEIGKECITVRDSPGFATSRLGVALGMEAIRMLEEGVASAEDIDKAMVLGYRHPVGPLRLTDMVGLDVRMAIGQYLSKTLGNAAFDPPELMQKMVAEGHLGAKSGKGFYRW